MSTTDDKPTTTEQKRYAWCGRGSRNEEHCAGCRRFSDWIDNATDLCERCYGAPRTGGAW